MMKNETSRLGRVIVLSCLLLVATGTALAQETFEIRNGRVLNVQGNVLTVDGPFGIRQILIPDDFRFDMDGRSLSIHDLEPGMPIAAVIHTKEKVVEMTKTEVREAEVVHTRGHTIVVRNDKGEIKKFSASDMRANNVVLHVDGKPIDPSKLRVGQRISATVITKQPPVTMTETQLSVYVANPPEPEYVEVEVAEVAAVAEVATVAAVERTPSSLPKTGSRLPALGLVGLGLLALGAGLTVVRLFLR